MAKKKKTESLTKAISKNKAKAADAQRKREADVDARWALYARALIADDLTDDEQSKLPTILESLGIQPEQVTADLAGVEKVQQYEHIISQKPVKPIQELRRERDDLLERYEKARRAVTTASSYASRRADLEMRISAIKHAAPQLWKHLDGLLPPVEPGVEPQPRERDRIIALFSQRRASSPVAAPDDGDPEPLEMIENVEEVPGTAPALAAGIEPPAAENQPMWPRPIKRRFDGVRKSPE